VTADFVKIYDLGADALSPQYYFLVPSGKVRALNIVVLHASLRCCLAPPLPYDMSSSFRSLGYFLHDFFLKVHDCTLAFMPDGSKYVLIMSSAGHIYYQPLCEESSARHGPFYVTNIMDVVHPDLEDSSEQIGGGGVSIFYYHTLQLLFFSYVHVIR